jgi:hypothetical protein
MPAQREERHREDSEPTIRYKNTADWAERMGRVIALLLTDEPAPEATSEQAA